MIKKEIRPGVIQLTLDEQRWYFVDDTPYPSVTWILNYFPKSIGFELWLADKIFSWEQAKQIVREAGDQGSRVHWGLEQYILGKQLRIDDCPAGFPYPFTAKEWQLVLNGVSWIEEYKPIILGVEQNVFGHDYAGTVDLYYQTTHHTGSQRRILDWKTGKSIYPNYKSQGAAYYRAMRSNDIEVDGFDIIRLGSKHKKGYEWFQGDEEDIQHYYNLFRCAKRFWADDNPNPAPKLINVPEVLNEDKEKESTDEKRLEDEDHRR